jgi:hypothetical protein
VQKYTYHDLTSSLSFIYYRIRQVDFDGTTSLSPMLSVPAFAIDKYAKPVIISKNHEITIATSNTSDLVYIKIIHLNGQVALEKSIMPNEPIFLSQLPSGSYIIVAEARGQQAVKKFFIP